MSRVKKKFYIILVTFALIAVSASLSTAAKIAIGLAWVGKSSMAHRVEIGLRETLKQKAPDIDIEINKELPDLAALKDVVKRYHKEKAAMIILRSNGAKYLADHAPSIPTFIGGCNDPEQLGVIKNKQRPGGNVTGVTYALSHELQLQKIKSIYPQMKSLLLLYEIGHPGSRIDRQNTLLASAKIGVAYQERGCRTLNEIENTLAAMTKGVDAIVIGNQALLMDNALDVVAAAGATPVFAYNKRPVYDGALAGLSANDIKLGQMLADSVIDVVINGKSIKDVPIKRDCQPRLYLNVNTAEKLGLQISYEILNSVEIVR